MKKFIRSKIDKTETSNRSSPNNLPDPPPPPNLETTVKNKAELKLMPDTLESLTNSPTILKAANNADSEREDYRSPVEVESPESFPPQEEHKRSENTGEPPAGNPPAGNPPETTIMCRDFIRGTCNRGTCKYAHKCDKSQLFEVYTFCRNFQNKICTLPNCKYVHASIFEEQEFYRTGKLPPHVLAAKCLPPPPPPPPGEPEPRVEIPTSFSNPPPLLPSSVHANSSMFACLPTSSSEPRIFHDEFGGGPSSARDGYNEPPIKKCKNCDAMDIRVRCHTDLLEKKRESIEDLKRKTKEIDTKKEKMSVILMDLIKLAKNSSPSSGPSSLFNSIGGDKNKMILEQLVNLNSTNRMSVGNTDNSCTGLLGDNLNIAAVLANLFSEHQSHAPDTGRRE